MRWAGKTRLIEGLGIGKGITKKERNNPVRRYYIKTSRKNLGENTGKRLNRQSSEYQERRPGGSVAGGEKIRFIPGHVRSGEYGGRALTNKSVSAESIRGRETNQRGSFEKIFKRKTPIRRQGKKRFL